MQLRQNEARIKQMEDEAQKSEGTLVDKLRESEVEILELKKQLGTVLEVPDASMPRTRESGVASSVISG